jgi:hypothetical protein
VLCLALPSTRLTLPLEPPSSDDHSMSSKASSAFSKAKSNSSQIQEKYEIRAEAEESSVAKSEPWELRADAGEQVSQIDPQLGPKATGSAESRKKSKKGSSNLKERLELHDAEMGEPADEEWTEFDAKVPAHSVVFLLHSAQPLSYISSLIEAEGPGFGSQGDVAPGKITFHSRATDVKRWSPSTSVGDFLQDAARE